MMDFENSDIQYSRYAIETCDREGESGKKDEAVGDRGMFEIRMDHFGET
jgi:hypothetical protein